MNSPFSPASLADAHDGTVTGDLCLANATLVLPDRMVTGRVTVEAGVITAIDEGDHVPEGAVDCRGDHVTPGLV